jgi:hypothetical protein
MRQKQAACLNRCLDGLPERWWVGQNSAHLLSNPIHLQMAQTQCECGFDVVVYGVSRLRNSVLIHSNRHLETVNVMLYKRGTLLIDIKTLLIRHKNLRIPLATVSS